MVPPKKHKDKKEEDALTVVRKRWMMCYVSTQSDANPTEENARPEFHVLEIMQSAGEECCTARIAVDMAALKRRVGNEGIVEDATRKLEIWLLKERVEDKYESKRDRRLFWGEITEMNVTLGANAWSLDETRTFTAKVMPYHFGETLDGQIVRYDGAEPNVKTVHYDLEFNPEIDGQVSANMHSWEDPEVPDVHSIWIDPESARSDKAKEINGTPKLWKMNEAIFTLCRAANGEDWISNPEYSELSTLLEESPELRNIILRRGAFLPEYLSALLPPFGRSWYLSVEVEDDEEEDDEEEEPDTKPRIVVFKRGDGPKKKLYLQEFGENVDLNKSNCNALQVSYDVGALANKIRVYGAIKEYQVTVRLYPAWPVEDDSMSRHNGKDAGTIPYRVWVANEGGDYCGLREEIGDDPPCIPTSDSVPKKRVAEDCLTYAIDAGDRGQSERRQPVLEYSIDNGATWTDIDNLSTQWQLLATEIGIRFTATAENEDDQPLPDELYETDPEKLQLRLTCTVKGDERLKYETEIANESPNGNTVTRVIDASDRFFFREIVDSGDHESKLDTENGADERDDTEEIEEFAKRLLETESAAQVRASVRLPGIITGYKIGDIITHVEGREIGFNRRAKGAADQVYLQVVGRRWQCSGEQSTELIMEPYDAALSG